MTRKLVRSSLRRVNSEPSSSPDGQDAVVQEAIDTTAASYAGDNTIDVEGNLRAELESRGVRSFEEAWITDTVEKIRQGREVVVGEHDGSIDAGEDQGG
jgi:hypothetical protein